MAEKPPSSRMGVHEEALVALPGVGSPAGVSEARERGLGRVVNLDLLPSELEQKATAVQWVGVDVETSGLFADEGARISCVAVAWPEYPGPVWMTCAWPFDQGVRDKLPTEQLDIFSMGEDPNLLEEEWRALERWLSGRSIAAHNLKFEHTMLTVGPRLWRGEGARSSELDVCTMIASSILEPRLPEGLDAVAQRNGFGRKVRRDMCDAWLRSRKYPKGRLDLVPWSIIREYVRQDALLAAQLWDWQQERFREDPEAAEIFWEREMPLERVLLAMEKRGMGWNKEKGLEAKKLCEREMRRLEGKLPFKPTLPAAKEYFFGKNGRGGSAAGRVETRPTEAGGVTLDEEMIRDLVRADVMWAPEWQKYQKLHTAVSRWYGGYSEMVGEDGRLRCSFRQTKVKSGRMSVERVQLQAVPKKPIELEGLPSVRSLFRAREGYELWNLDLAQAELRVAAKYANCGRMLSMLAQGADLHGITCQEVLGVEPGAADWKEKRDIAKRLTFGGIFSIGPETFQKTLKKLADIELEYAECEKYVWNWRRIYPEFGYALRRAERLVQQRGWVRVLPRTEYERKSWFTADEFPSTGWSRIVQNSLAEFLKILLIEVEKRWPGLLIMTVHDSLVLEISQGETAALGFSPRDVARDIADYGAGVGTDLFGIEMKMEYELWKG